MYLPWGYDISQVTILICYLVAGFHGTAIFYSPIISDINAIHLIKMFMYAGSGMLLCNYHDSQYSTGTIIMITSWSAWIIG